MTSQSRRDFLRRSTLGLAALGAGSWTLRAGVPPTEGTGVAGDFEAFLQDVADPTQAREVTASDIEGPFFVPNAPFRAKVCPPLEPGKVIVVRGRVYGHDTKKPLANTIIDVWQADAEGEYDNSGLRGRGKPEFKNRVRLVTDHTGYYEYETIRPAPYPLGPNSWRTPHIHYIVRHTGYKQLTTQMYFKGERLNKTDRFYRKSLEIELAEHKTKHGSFQDGQFDIVLAPD